MSKHQWQQSEYDSYFVFDQVLFKFIFRLTKQTNKTKKVFGKVSMGLCKSIVNNTNKPNKSFLTREYELIYHDCFQDFHNETIPDYLKKIYCCQGNENNVEENGIYLHHEYCCTWSNLMIQHE